MLFTTVEFHNTSEASARLAKTTDKNNVSAYIHELDRLGRSDTKTIAIDAKVSRTNNSYLLKNLQREEQLLKNNAGYESTNLLLVSDNSKEEYNFDLVSQEGFSSNTESSKAKTIRTISLYLFFLLFVPFGIFYPFFLFYRKLLNTDCDRDNSTEDSTVLADRVDSKLSLKSFESESLKLEESINNIQAVVSKLQMAFAVKDDSLKHKLEQLCSSVDSRTDRGIAELMRKTISLLINEDELTHVCNSSRSFSVNQIKTEFEAICTREKNKSMSEKLAVVGEDDQESKSSSPSTKDLTGYIVVTLALCTSHTEPLFTEIGTKKQLLEELSELGKMRQDDLIKFDLLWNPQSENQYLSNNELLINYIDMMRLF